MEAIAELGDIASIVGLFITIGGFGIALWQIQKSKSASEQARQVAESVRAQILQMNAIQDISAASKAFEDIRRLHRQRAWEALPDRYTSLKQLLISIKGRTPNLSNAQKAQIQGAVQQVSNIEAQVEIAIGGKDEPEVQRINQIVSRQIDRLADLLVDVQNEIERVRQ
jgi:hypothetical protein